MIYRIRIKGFKNIKDLEVYLGPFTCIAGGNGVGKSNFFDALSFLKALTNRDNTLIDAAFKIRSKENEKKPPGKDIESLFYQDENGSSKTISFEVDMVCDSNGVDDLGQMATSNTTLLRYGIEIGIDLSQKFNGRGLFLIKEELIPLPKTDAKKILSTMGATYDWFSQAIGVGSRRTPFIETTGNQVHISTDQTGGKKRSLNINSLPRTMLSTATAVEYPTMTIVQKEFQKLKILQFEPTALREPDSLSFSEGAILTSEGGHLPNTLKRLKIKNADVLQRISNHLVDLIQDPFELRLDEDTQRDLLILSAKRKGGNFLPAKSLSDGTLRFLALASAIEDPDFDGIICLEEPENGIHPERIAAIINLLENMAFDFNFPIGDENPLRQVIINTHSPGVVSVVSADSLLFAYLESNALGFKFLSKTWREELQTGHKKINRGEILRYFQPLPVSENKKKTVRQESGIQIRIDFETPG
jgi:predicted ATPase